MRFSQAFFAFAATVMAACKSYQARSPVRLRPESAALHGFTAGLVRQAVTTLISGRKVGEVYQDQRVHDVTVWSLPAVRADYTMLLNLFLLPALYASFGRVSGSPEKIV